MWVKKVSYGTFSPYQLLAGLKIHVNMGRNKLLAQTTYTAENGGGSEIRTCDFYRVSYL